MNNWFEGEARFLSRNASLASKFSNLISRFCGAKQPTLFIINYSLFIIHFGLVQDKLGEQRQRIINSANGEIRDSMKRTCRSFNEQ